MWAAAAQPRRQPPSQAPKQQARDSVVQQLLEAGASVKRTDLRGWQALHHTAAAGHEAAIKQLVAAGADPMARTLDNRQTAYELAAASGHRGAAQLLLRLVKERQRGRRGSGPGPASSSSRDCGPPSPAEAAAIVAEMRAEALEASAARSRRLNSAAGMQGRQAAGNGSFDGAPAQAQRSDPAGLAMPPAFSPAGNAFLLHPASSTASPKHGACSPSSASNLAVAAQLPQSSAALPPGAPYEQLCPTMLCR